MDSSEKTILTKPSLPSSVNSCNTGEDNTNNVTDVNTSESQAETDYVEVSENSAATYDLYCRTCNVVEKNKEAIKAHKNSIDHIRKSIAMMKHEKPPPSKRARF